MILFYRVYSEAYLYGCSLCCPLYGTVNIVMSGEQYKKFNIYYDRCVPVALTTPVYEYIEERRSQLGYVVEHVQVFTLVKPEHLPQGKYHLLRESVVKFIREHVLDKI